jgi:ABC-2 type transport system permease protein
MLFWAFMGAVFSSITPEMKEMLIQVLTVMAITTGALLGVPVNLVEMYSKDIKKAYVASNIPLWIGIASNFISALIHLSIVSIIIFILTPLAFDGTIPNNISIYIAYLLILVITSISIGTILGIYVTDQSKLTIYSQMVYLPSLMLSGIMFDSSLLPKAFVFVGKFFPATWGFKGMNSLEFLFELFLPQLIILFIAFILIVIRLNSIVKE